MLATLLRLFIRLQKREFHSQTTAQKMSIAIVLVVLFFIGLFLATSFGAISRLADQAFLLFAFQSILVTLFIGLTLFTIPHVFDKLYGSSDLQLLFSLPLSTRTIFLAKLGEHLLTIPLMVFVGSTILAVIAGVSGGASWPFFLLLLPVLLFVVLGAIAFVYLLTLALAQIIPGHRTKELMTVTSTLGGISAFFLIQAFNLSSINTHFPPESIRFSYPNWLPISWAGNVVADGFLGTVTVATGGYLAAFATFVLILLLFSLTLVERGFRQGWIQSHDTNKKKHKKRAGKHQVAHPVIALIEKEQHYFFRDVREWLQLMPIVFLLFVMLFPLFSQGLYPLLQDVPLLSFSVFQMVFFLIFTFASGTFASSSVGREGPNIQLLMVLPIKGMDIALAKLLFHWGFLVSILFLFEVVAFFVFGWPFWLTLFGFVIIAITIAGLNSISLYAGTQSPRFNERQPQARLQTAASVLLMFVSFLYIILFIIPVGIAIVPIGELPALIEEESSGSFVLGLLRFFIGFQANNQVIGIIVSSFFLTIVSSTLSWFFVRKSAQAFNEGITIEIQSK